MLKTRENASPFSLVRNQFVQLVVFDPKLGKLTLFSQITSVKGDSISIVWPKTEKGNPYFFKNVSFAVFQAIINGKVISFKIAVTKSILDSFSDKIFTFNLPYFWDKVEQKRKFHRLKANIPVKFRLLKEDGFSEELMDADSIDISVGGMEITSLELFETNSYLELFFSFEFFDFRGVVAQVLRRSVDSSLENLLYCYSLEYICMFEREKDTLNQLLMRSLPKLPKPKIITEE